LETKDKQNISEGPYLSPATSKETQVLDKKSALNYQDSSFSPKENVR
jgi:hypothetical protein